jgi:hypothetical protein
MNDVRATEKVFDHNQSDYTARKILSELSGLSINATTNQHTTRIIFEGDKNAQKENKDVKRFTTFHMIRVQHFLRRMSEYVSIPKIVALLEEINASGTSS